MIRTESGCSVLRFAELVGVPRRTYHARLARLRSGEAPKGPCQLRWMGKLAGAVTTLRLDSTREERDGHAKRRTNYLHAIPETDPRFKRLFGPRETAESFFRSLKILIPDQRALSATDRRVQLNLLASQTQESMKALISYHERTGADVSRWLVPNSRNGGFAVTKPQVSDLRIVANCHLTPAT